MQFRSADLPSIGTKYELQTETRDTLAIIYQQSGAIQVYITPAEGGEGCSASLKDVEARRLGNILTGAIMEAEPEGIEIAFSALEDLRISVHTYIVGDSAVGCCIGDLQIRSKTGATVVAVSRKGRNTINPGPGFVFEEGDALVVIGEAEQLKEFEQVVLGR